MAGFGPASLPHLALILDTLAPGGSAKAPGPLPSLGLVMYDAGIFGTTTKTLGTLTAASAGTVLVSGTLGKTLTSISISAVGSVSGNYGSISAPVPLPHLATLLPTISGIIGQTSVTLEALTVASLGDVPGNEIWPYEYDDKPARAPIYWPHARNVDWFQTDTVLRDSGGGRTGVVGQNLQNLTVVSGTSVIAAGTLAKTLTNLTFSATGVVTVSGSTIKTLGALTVSSGGTVAGGFVATLFKVMDTLTVSSAGIGSIAGSTVKTLGTLTVTAAARNDSSATLAKTLQGINSNIDATVLSGYVAAVNSFLSPLTLSARIGGPPIDAIGATGGWLPKPKKRRRARLEPQTEDEFYASIPSADEIEAERERLAALPKRAQNAARKVIDSATDKVTPRQAALLAEAYLHEPLQDRVRERARKAFSSSRVKLDEGAMTMIHGLILAELARKADRDALVAAMAEREAEEAEIKAVLDLWISL